MAKLEIGSGMAEYLSRLTKTEKATPAIIKAGVYDGAGIMADEFRKEIESLPESCCTDIEREGLLEGLTISKMDTSTSYYNTRLAEAGYNKHVTEKYPNGKANAMIARSINAGMSWSMAGKGWINRTVNNTKARAEKAMADRVEKEIQKSMEG